MHIPFFSLQVYFWNILIPPLQILSFILLGCIVVVAFDIVVVSKVNKITKTSYTVSVLVYEHHGFDARYTG